MNIAFITVIVLVGISAAGILIIFGLRSRHLVIRIAVLLVFSVLLASITHRCGRDTAVGLIQGNQGRGLRDLVDNIGELAKQGKTNEIIQVTSRFPETFRISLDQNDSTQFWGLVVDSMYLMQTNEKTANQVPEDTARKLADPQR
ncbi:MAG: hypothetical protein NTV49_00015 [Kiritimatiellaeota bacterium]|nr:hypothetical protein [Kiritimatiellota bacterium]